MALPVQPQPPAAPIRFSDQQLQNWAVTKPLLERGRGLGNYNIRFPTFVIPDTDVRPPVDPTCLSRFTGALEQFGYWVQAKWDRGRNFILPDIAAPACLVVGVLLIVFGVLGAVSLVWGRKISFLEFFMKNTPLSMVFALSILKSGVHLIYTSTRLGQGEIRAQQKNEEYAVELAIQEAIGKNYDHSVDELMRLDSSLCESRRIQGRITEGDLFRFEVAQVMRGRPDLNRYGTSAIPKMTNKDNFYKTIAEKVLPGLGIFDMALGQVMLLAGITSIVFIGFPNTRILPGIELIAKDPALSLAFSLVLISNWINCTMNGWRMLTYGRRQKERAEKRDTEQLILYGIERRYAIELMNRIEDEGRKAQVRGILDKYFSDAELAKRVAKANEAKTNPKPENCVAQAFHWAGGKIVPKMAGGSIVFGLISVTLGLVTLATAFSKRPLFNLTFLTKNTPVSAIFAGTLFVSGIHEIHRGAALSQKKKKFVEKAKTAEARSKLIELLITETPKLNPPVDAPAARSPRIEPEIVSGVQANALSYVRRQEAKASCYEGWLKTLKPLALPNFVLGCFLFFCGVAGLALSLSGTKVPEQLRFIVTDPSYSSVFCLGIIFIAVDNFSTSWRMVSFFNRKKADKKSLEILQECYNRFAPEAIPPMQGQRV